MHFVSLKMHIQNIKDKQKENSRYLSKCLLLTECERISPIASVQLTLENKRTFLFKELET